MGNSRLVDYVKISPNSTNPRKDKIKKITIHHVAGDLTVEQIGNVFAPKSRRASANYGVDSDGRVGMYVEENNRAWTSGNATNDNQAVTIEVANSEIGGEWKVSDKALEKTIELCVDICRRNGIKKLNYTGDARGNLTRHNMFQATVCPGPYLQSKFPYIEKEVNKRLKATTEKSKQKTNLKVDGYWGPATTKALQETLGTPVDGVISGQYPNHITRSIYSANFSTRTGSMVIRALQRKIGVKVDGYIGPETVRGLQRHLGTIVDGVISRPSLMVKELQKRLNNGTF